MKKSLVRLFSKLVGEFPIDIDLPLLPPKLRIPSHIQNYLIPIELPPSVDWRLIVLCITTLKLIVIQTTTVIVFEGSPKISLVPPEVGEYIIHLEINGEPLPKSPILIEIILAPNVVPIGSEQSVKVGESACVPF